MSLDLTYADHADQVLRARRRAAAARAIAAAVLVLMLAAELGLVFPNPIHAY